MNKIKLECGCEFDLNKNNQPIIDYNINRLNFDCPLIWDLIGSGRTIGLFQIDSGLGQMMSKRLKPENIEHLSALVSIMRPSCLQGKLEDGKSIADHYIDRKNGVEEVTVEYEPLRDILKNNYQMLIYQEDSLKIAQDIAGFSLQKSDDLRRAIGKKKADLMSKLESEFIEGCEKVGKVTKEEASNIFSQIKASQRYAFNKAHSVAYSITTILTAIGKAHFPIRFFKAYLDHSTDKQKPLEEVRNLVNDARHFNIDVCKPDLRLKNEKFLIKDGRIYFGLAYIKGVGESAFKALISLIGEMDLNSVVWTEFLFKTLLEVKKDVVKNIIAVGCLDYLGISREQMLFEHDVALKIKPKEVEWIKNNLNLSDYKNIEPILAEILNHPSGKGKPTSNKNRKNIIKGLHFSVVNKPFSVIDNIRRITALESSYLGVPLSFHKTDSVDKDLADSTCKEVNDGKNGIVKLIVEISRLKEITTKKTGEQMAFMTVEDASGVVDNIAIFSNLWNKYKNSLWEGATILLVAKRSYKGSLVLLSCQSI